MARKLESEYPAPWWVWSGPLNAPPEDKIVVQILDAKNNVVLPASAFEHLKTLSAQKQLARRIILAVNHQTTETHGTIYCRHIRTEAPL